MKTETPQLIHRQDYTPPPFLVDHVDLDVQFHAATPSWSLATCNCGAIRRAPGQSLQLDGHGLETLVGGDRWTAARANATPAPTRR
jgi:aminopeptidase N